MFKLIIATVLPNPCFQDSLPSVISRNLLILEIRECQHVCVDSKWRRGATPLIIHCVPATVLAASRNQTQVILREEKTELQLKIVPELQTPRGLSAMSPFANARLAPGF